VAVKWVAGGEGETAVLYAAYEGDTVPWAAVARELALALRPNQPPGGLALGIKEILAAPSLAAAAEILGELGYPPLPRQAAD
jgi:predicted deacylase